LHVVIDLLRQIAAKNITGHWVQLDFWGDSWGRVSDFFREQNIALAQQQRAKMVALDTEFEALESKVKILDAENLHLRRRGKSTQARNRGGLRIKFEKRARPMI